MYVAQLGLMRDVASIRYLADILSRWNASLPSSYHHPGGDVLSISISTLAFNCNHP